MQTYKVVITKEHCIGRDYMDTTNCPLCAAIKEQYPNSGLAHVGGTYVRNKSGNIQIDFNTDWEDGWNSARIRELLNGEIDKFVLVLESDKFPDMTRGIKTEPSTTPQPKERIVYVSIPETVKGQTDDLILN